MKKSILFLLVTGIVFFSFQGVSYVEPLNEGSHVFKADVTLAQQVPEPQPSLGIGVAVFVLNREQTELSYAVGFSGLSGPLAIAHLHGPAGADGTAAPVRTLCGAPVVPEAPAECPGEDGLITGVWTSADAQPLTGDLVQALLDGQIYVNLHTATNPPGEIRGQLVRIN